AVAVAAALGAEECMIFTDVDGVYTTDPRVVPDARRLSRITFEEMLEMASLGSKVLQIRSVEFAGKYRVRTRVLSSLTPADIPVEEEAASGTLITFEEDENMEKAVISGIAFSRDAAKITVTNVPDRPVISSLNTFEDIEDLEQDLICGIAFSRDAAKITVTNVPDRPGIADQSLGLVAAANIEVDIIIQNQSVGGMADISFTVPHTEFKRTMAIMEREVRGPLGTGDIIGDPDICKVSAVGIGMRSHAGVASTMFKTLLEEGINIQMISTSEIKISVVIADKYMELAVRALHKAFGLEQEIV